MHDHAHDSHGHGHDHDHAPTVTPGNERRVLAAFWITFGFMLVEVAGGWLSGSLALLADAGHMLTDAAALALSYFAFRIGRRAADGQRTFGYQRLEVVAAFLNAAALFLIALWILWEAWQRISTPHEVLAGPMMAVAVAGLVVNLLVLWILSRGDTRHVNLQGAVLHVLGDLLGSVGAIAAAILITLTGWMPVDPILSVLVSVLILRTAYALLKRSLNILLEGAPDGVTPDRITAHLRAAFPQLSGVRHVHVWQITQTHVLATLHIRAAGGTDMADLITRITDELRHEFGISHATIATDWGDPKTDCPLRDSHP